MDIIDQSAFQSLCQTGEILHDQCYFLDGIKIGLRVWPDVVQMSDYIDLSVAASNRPVRVNIGRQPLVKGKLYLARTVERICLPSSVIGVVHTRSRWANLGLDCVGSSNMIGGGFGGGTPIPLVLQLKPAVTLSGIDLRDALAALVLFRLIQPVAAGPGEEEVGIGRFPLDLWQPL
jgi:deoxycytidine triphosphate deaminase